ncbi:protein CYSTEINE-RICH TRANSMEMBRANE MODULE 9-like [Prosopis cineraria]|uniref:protein CYSTEINE-RICH TRANSMEMBRANE MODULE 9-like n=1 Tax=Prosopis cineraria TaxID=364024 RepID=UPI00240FF573|nr:protein CYSTEINE-RICH TRANSMEMBRANE MODULE 9-like [Prosopis cineraria]
MSQHNQVSEACPPSIPVMAYPPPGQAYPQHQTGPYEAPAPPVGYPTMKGDQDYSSQIAETKSRGEGFWKGCVAALCCCWVLEFCCGC